MDLNGPLPFQAHYLWIVGGLFLVVGEILTGGFVLLWFAIGAFAAGLCALGGASFNVQLVAFGVSSLLLFMGSRTIFRTVLMRRGRNVPTNVDAMIGTHAEVLDEIGPGLRAGTVRIGGETWDAISTGTVLHSGTRVTIEAIQGLKLRVRAIEQASPLAETGRDRQ